MKQLKKLWCKLVGHKLHFTGWVDRPGLLSREKCVRCNSLYVHDMVYDTFQKWSPEVEALERVNALMEKSNVIYLNNRIH
jgi:hypothetical protein